MRACPAEDRQTRVLIAFKDATELLAYWAGLLAEQFGCLDTIRYVSEGMRAFTPVQVFSMIVWAFEQNDAD